MFRRHAVLPLIIITGVVLAVFFTAPKSEDFWWTDSASFALNGELIRDYVVSGFHQSPMAFAQEFFRRYPAITISLYPPIFPAAEAAAFGLFGFSHFVAQATVAAFTFLAAAGTYRMLRTTLSPLDAAAGVLMLFAVPGVLLWSRQVMMELPSLAFLLMACGFFLDYEAARRQRDLYLAVLLVLAAIYTKQTAIFAVPAFAISLVVSEGWRGLRGRDIRIAAAAGVAGLVPLAAFTLAAAPQVLDIALARGIGAHSADAGRTAGHLAQALAYGLALPEVIGWPVLIAAICYLVTIPVRGWRTAPERRLAVLMLAWFGCGYAFISLTGHFETRYAMVLGVPCAMVAILLIAQPLGRWAGAWAASGVAAILFAVSVTTLGVNRMTGYDRVAAYILDHSKQDDVIWFQGQESKNLVFSLRSHSSKPKVFVLRAEKLLVDYRIVRESGITDRGWSTEKLRDLVEQSGISMVVLQPGFWADMPSMSRMQDYIGSGHFRQVAEFPIDADEPSQRTTIRIFVKQDPAPAAGNASPQ
jgi:4-amino-4-deoxy-L-arabinose transferase-like glycosyltransferase